MKRMKKLASLLLALVMVLSMAMSVSAANTNPHTITINFAESTQKHTYEAYQVFAGDYYEETVNNVKKGALTNVVWGSGVNGTALLAALQKETAFADCESAADVADVLTKMADNSDELDAFATIVGNHLATVAGTSTETTSPYKINVNGDGYYLVKDQDGSLKDLEKEAYTKYILKVVGDVTVDAKAEVPSIKKEIEETNGAGETVRVDANNGSVGDVVDYVLTSKVPAMDGYEKYFFIVHDTLSEGLTLNYNADTKAGFVITVGNKTLVNGTDYTVTVDGQSFKIVFNNFVQYKEVAGADITIKYSATINEKAEIGNVGNPNEVYLEYSNNPNIVPGGENEPTGDDVTGITPKDYVITYVGGVKIFKVDENGKKLTGAEFELTGTSANIVHVVGQTFKEDANGDYYKLKDGTFTTTAPNPDTEAKYESLTDKYSLVDVDEWVETKNNEQAVGYVDADGYLVFDGLGEGTYTITEIKAPAGYNKLEEPIIVKVTFVKPEKVSTGTEKGGWVYEYSFDGEKFVTTDSSKAFEISRVSITVENNKGTVLPSTGGMGTTIFYVIGTVLVLGAAVLMVTKKRMNSAR